MKHEVDALSRVISKTQITNEKNILQLSKGNWKTPPFCTGDDNCEYQVTWETVSVCTSTCESFLEVNVKQKSGIENWIAIAFSEDLLMTNTDIIAGYFVEGKPPVQDFFDSPDQTSISYLVYGP